MTKLENDKPNQKDTTPIKFGENEYNMTEVDDASFFRFEKIGDAITGILINKDRSDRYNFGIYTIQNEAGDRVRFHGTTQLDGLMLDIDLQTVIKVEFVDTQQTPQGALKLFKVFKAA